MIITVELRESITSTIPQVIALLDYGDEDVRRAGADALSKLSEKGKTFGILIWHI